MENLQSQIFVFQEVRGNQNQNVPDCKYIVIQVYAFLNLSIRQQKFMSEQEDL